MQIDETNLPDIWLKNDNDLLRNNGNIYLQNTSNGKIVYKFAKGLISSKIHKNRECVDNFRGIYYNFPHIIYYSCDDCNGRDIDVKKDEKNVKNVWYFAKYDEENNIFVNKYEIEMEQNINFRGFSIMGCDDFFVVQNPYMKWGKRPKNYFCNVNLRAKTTIYNINSGEIAAKFDKCAVIYFEKNKGNLLLSDGIIYNIAKGKIICNILERENLKGYYNFQVLLDEKCVEYKILSRPNYQEILTGKMEIN